MFWERSKWTDKPETSFNSSLVLDWMLGGTIQTACNMTSDVKRAKRTLTSTGFVMGPLCLILIVPCDTTVQSGKASPTQNKHFGS